MSFSKQSDTVEGHGAVPEGEVEQGRPLPAVVAGLHDLDVGVAPRGVVEVRRVRPSQELLPEFVCGLDNVSAKFVLGPKLIFVKGLVIFVVTAVDRLVCQDLLG